MRLPQVNPIFLRVIRASGRRARHMWVRTAYLLVILGTLVIFLLGELMGSRGATAALAELGEKLFRAVSWTQLVLILLLSPIYTAGAISQERDAETFSVLLATPLSNLQIVLGSLLSRLFFVIALLLSTLPLFALLYYFGGFELRDVFLSYGVAATSALLTGSVAIAVSIIYTGTRRVIVSFFLASVAYVVGLLLVDHMLLPAVLPTWTVGSFDWLHPIGAIQATMQGGQLQRPAVGDVNLWGFLVHYPEYAYLVFSTVLSLGIIVVATLLVRRLARGYGRLARRIMIAAGAVLGTVVVVGVGAVLVELRGWRSGLVLLGMLLVVITVAVLFFSIRRRNKPRTVWDNPIAWRERVTRTATARRSAIQFLTVLGSILALCVVVVLKTAGQPAESAQWFVFAVASTQAFVVLMVGGTMAASCVSYEREQGTLDMILTTPITPRYFITGKLMGIIRYLGLFLAMMFLLTFGAFLVARLPVEDYVGSLVPKDWLPAGGFTPGAPGAASLGWDEWPLISAFYPILITGSMAAAMATVGMTFSLRARKTSTAALYTSLIVLGVAAGVTCCCGLTTFITGPIGSFVSPFLALYACILPNEYMHQFNLSSAGSVGVFHRVFGIHVGALATASVYVAFAAFRLRAMVRTFDQQTRQKV